MTWSWWPGARGRQHRAIAAVVKAVESGELPVEKINQSVRKILDYKLRLRSIRAPGEAIGALRASVDSFSEKVKQYNFLKTARV